jgi:2-keto-3-deoxy-L-rhamnonate aldolase
MTDQQFPGIYTPVPTFFKKDLFTIDYETQVAHAEYLKKNGISGQVLMGSTGEQAHLTRVERASVVSAIHEEIPDFLLMGGVAANSLRDALDEIDSLKNVGASYPLVLPSNYFGTSRFYPTTRYH